MIEELGRRVRNKEITWKEASELLEQATGEQISGNAVKMRFYRLMKRQDKPAINDFQKDRTTIFADGTLEAEKVVNLPKDIKEDPNKVLEVLGYDPNKWEIQYMQFSNWQQHTKEQTTKELYAVKFKLKPVVKEKVSLEDSLKIAKEVFASGIKPFTFKHEAPKELQDDLLIEFPAIELHLGKLAHHWETGENYDYKIASERFEEAIDEALIMQDISKASSLMLSIGNDFFNTDTITYTTTKGTPQQNDVRWQKMFMIGLELYKEALLKFRQQFNKVDVNLVQGNHDEMSSFYLYIALSQFFKNDEKINFSDNYKKVQAYEFGDCAIFTAHGEKNLKRLISSIPAEFYETWGRTKHRELHLGHLHKEVVVDDESGMITRRIGSPSGTDKWHYEERYIGATKKHQLFLWHKHKGLLDIKNIPFEIDKKKVKIKEL